MKNSSLENPCYPCKQFDKHFVSIISVSYRLEQIKGVKKLHKNICGIQNYTLPPKICYMHFMF
jgi:hypothetical protein